MDGLRYVDEISSCTTKEMTIYKCKSQVVDKNITRELIFKNDVPILKCRIDAITVVWYG